MVELIRTERSEDKEQPGLDPHSSCVPGHYRTGAFVHFKLYLMSSQLQPPNPYDTPAPSLAGLSGMNTPNTPPNDHTLLGPETHTGGQYTEKAALDSRRPSRTKWIIAGAGVFVVVLIVIIVPVYFTVIKPKNTSSQSNIASPNENSGNNTSPDATPPETRGATTGGDGSIVVTANGNFTYKNPFGGFWVYDSKDPFNNGAKAQVRTHSIAQHLFLTRALNRQSWTPALNETWKWGTDTIKG